VRAGVPEEGDRSNMQEINYSKDYLEGERVLSRINPKTIQLVETHSNRSISKSAYAITKNISDLFLTEKRFLIKTAKGEIIQIAYNEVSSIEYKNTAWHIVIHSIIMLITFSLPTGLFFYLATGQDTEKTARDYLAIAAGLCGLITLFAAIGLAKELKLKGLYITSRYGSESQDGPRIIRLIGKSDEINKLYKSLKEKK
jgi:hypothetical protein